MRKIASKSLIAFLTICTISLCAEEDQTPFNAKPLPVETQALIDQIEKEKSEQEVSVMENLASYLQIANETVAVYNVQPLASRSIQSFSVVDRIIKLDDGSEWMVDTADQSYLGYIWQIGHIVYLSHRKGDDTKPYQLENLSINHLLKVTPFNGPNTKGPTTNWIAGMNQDLGHVYLLNGSNQRTSWVIDTAFLSLFKSWALDETIIIMKNNKSWAERNFPTFFPSYDYVLLNVNENHNIPARQL